MAAKKKKRRRLVPLMPILERLGACEEGKVVLAEMAEPTFRGAYRRFMAEAGLTGHLGWLGSRLLSERITRSCLCPGCYLGNLSTLPALVERALYEYAKREGLA